VVHESCILTVFLRFLLFLHEFQQSFNFSCIYASVNTDFDLLYKLRKIYGHACT